MRVTLAFLPAVFVTLALFYLMHFMISGRSWISCACSLCPKRPSVLDPDARSPRDLRVLQTLPRRPVWFRNPYINRCSRSWPPSSRLLAKWRSVIHRP